MIINGINVICTSRHASIAWPTSRTAVSRAPSPRPSSPSCTFSSARTPSRFSPGKGTRVKISHSYSHNYSVTILVIDFVLLTFDLGVRYVCPLLCQFCQICRDLQIRMSKISEIQSIIHHIQGGPARLRPRFHFLISGTLLRRPNSA